MSKISSIEDISEPHVDVLVAGGGAGGICAAVAAARAGARTLLIESADEIGGTGVRSPLGILCGLGPGARTNINLGFLPLLYPNLFPERDHDERITYYDARDLAQRYQRLIAQEKNLSVWTGTKITQGIRSDVRTLAAVETVGQHKACVHAAVFVDGTADGNLAALAGADFQQGRTKDGMTQPATLTFVVNHIQPDKLTPPGVPPLTARRWSDKVAIDEALGLSRAYRLLKEQGRTRNPKRADQEVVFFPSEDVSTLVFNHTRVTGVDPTDPASLLAGYQDAKQQGLDLWEAIRGHPALDRAQIQFSSVLGVREGRRIVGDYLLTAEDCLGEARFEDRVAACCYPIDIHDPEGNDTRMTHIPGSGYYHIPYRCLRAKEWTNLLLGSRCISGTHEAHSSYRVMAPITAVGQAAGVAAALAARSEPVAISGVDAVEIREVLRRQNQPIDSEME